jgi:hypothetical protein
MEFVLGILWQSRVALLDISQAEYSFGFFSEVL